MGVRQGIGLLSAVKEAIGETIHEALERGDLSAERARDVMKGALDRAQAAAVGARDRLDFVNRSELEALEAAVRELRERVAALEDEVFGGRARAGAGSSTGGSGGNA